MSRKRRSSGRLEVIARLLQWRRSIGADTILDDFTFPERDAFISLYPQGYCNVDKMVRGALVRIQAARIKGSFVRDRVSSVAASPGIGRLVTACD